MKIKNESRSKSYWESYQSEIAPRLKEIDIMIKTLTKPMNISQAAKALDITEQEVASIMAENNIVKISEPEFFIIMLNGTSNICQLYKREVKCGSPYVYTREDISYIYALDINKVNTACDSLNIKEATAFTLPLLLSQITV